MEKGEQLKEGATMPTFNPEQFPEEKRHLIELIEDSINHPRNGEAYEGQGASAETGKAGRHPVKPDTTTVLTLFAENKRQELDRPLHIVEFGVAFLVSGSYLLYGAPDSKYTGWEFGDDVAKEAQERLTKIGVDAELVPTKVEDTLDEVMMEKPPIDILTIDHNKASYLPDFKKAEKYLAPGALVLVDNVNDRRAECQDFIDYVTEKYGCEILPTQAGLLIVRMPVTREQAIREGIK